MPNLAASHPDVLASSRTLIFGATSGIGAAVASAVTANKGKVFISSSSEANIAAAVKHLKSIYPDAIISGGVADLSKQDTLESAVKTTLDAAVEFLGGPLDHIVYTAGDNHIIAEWKSVQAKDAYNGWTVRYQGPLMIGQLVSESPGKYLTNARTSSITFTSGILGRRPHHGLVANWPGALEVMTRSLAVSVAPIRANTVVPGAIRTEIWEKLGMDEKATNEFVKQFEEKSLVKAMARPDEAAEAYLFLMRCGFVTGQDIVVDGGFSYC